MKGRARRSATIALVLGLLPAMPLTAQTDEAREPEVINYRLSMKKLWQVIEVQRELIALMAKRPELFEEAGKENEARIKAGKPSPTVKQQAAQLESRPAIRAVITKAGTTPLDFVVATEAMASAMISAEIMAGRLDSRAGPPPTTAAEKANVALLQKNQSEWQKIQKEFERLGDEIVNTPD